MSRPPIVKKSDRFDVAKRLVTSGVSWGERTPWAETIWMVMAALSLAVVILGLIGSPVAMLFALFSLGGSIHQLLTIPEKPRALIFHASGRMETPHGIWFFPTRGLLARPSEISFASSNSALAA